MTPSERERRIKAAAHAVSGVQPGGALSLEIAERILDAADEAVPVVSEEEAKARAWAWVGECIEEAQQRAERAEAAARDFAEALAEIAERPRGQGGGSRSQRAADALARHPSFSGEDGTVERMGAQSSPLDGVHAGQPSTETPIIKEEEVPSFSGEEGTEG